MTRKQGEYVVNVEENVADTFPRNQYCSNEGTHYGCRLHNVIIQPQMATGKPWSLWKICLVSLLACLIASAIVVLVLYFGHFGKPISNTTIVIHTDGKSSQDGRIPSSTTSLTSTSPGPPSTSSSTPVAGQSTSTGITTTSMETTTSTTSTTPVHKVVIEDEGSE